MASVKTVCLATGLAVVVGLGGCSSGPDAMAWAGAVCRSLTPWREQISDLTQTTNEQMTAGTTPTQARENLVRLFDGASAASERARAGVHKAGVPRVDGGAGIAARFEHTLAATRDAYAHASGTIAKLDTGSSDAFYAAVGTTVATLGKEYDAGQLDPAKLDSRELHDAFAAVPECQ